MEQKFARIITVFTCVFSLFVCAAVWFLPAAERGIEAFGAGILREQLEREERYAMLEKMSGLEIMRYNTKQVQEKVEEGEEEAEEISFVSYQMQLELPEGTHADDINIVQDYVNQQIRIEIPRADKNYLYDYQMLGKSDDIESLDYFSREDSGEVVLTMNKVVEVESSHDDQYLYLNFLSPKDIYDRVIVIDAGHGGAAPGAVSGDCYEKNLTLAIVQQIKRLFDEADDPRIGVYYTRLDDSDPALARRVGLANNADADLFISVHINSLKNSTNVEGVEVLYDELAEDTAFDTKDLARLCLEEEVKALGAVKRRLADGNRIYIIRHSKAPAALVEVGFMNNPKELAKLTDPSYQQKAAEGIYRAVQKALKKLDKAGR